MQILLIRHAIAEDAEQFARTGGADEDRALTEDGIRRFRRIARGLHTQIPQIDLVFVSQLRRAQETAALLRVAYPSIPTHISAHLAPYAEPHAVLEQLHNYNAEIIAVVGHEPHLGRFASALLGVEHSVIRLKKGAAVLLDCPAGAQFGQARLLWALTAKQLRALGG